MGLKRKDLVYPELSYTVIGILFNVYNELGPGHKEKYYQAGVAQALKEANIPFIEQLYAPLIYKDNKVGKYYFDFLIDNKIVLELKSGEKFLR